jgi:hypothetical protein
VKVIDVVLSDGGLRAYVTLSPNWLARLFGAQRLVVELIKDPDALYEREVWKSALTRRDLPSMDHGSMIRCALEAQPQRAIGKLPAVYVVQLTKDEK